MVTAYEVLGVRPDVDYETFRTAYLEAAKPYHPDITSGASAAEAHFKRINAAHDIVKSPAVQEGNVPARDPSADRSAQCDLAGLRHSGCASHRSSPASSRRTVHWSGVSLRPISASP
jgi:DnaJ domain